VTPRHRVRFYQQLAVLVRAGLPLRASMLRLKERMGDKAVAVLAEKLATGERLDEAFVAAGFSSFECQLVTAGERSAQLETVFQHLSEFWARELEMRQALIRPLIYPVVVLHLAVLVGAVVEYVTNPSPLVLVHLGEKLALLYFAGITLYFGARASWSVDLVRLIWLRVPLIGSAIRSAYAYRWITALKLEFSAGISLSRAVGDAWRASGYVGCDRFAQEGELAMREGTDLSTLVRGWKRLPRDWPDFIETGEISGALETAFKNLEAEAARNWSWTQQRMAEWLPKILYFIVLLIAAAQVGKLMYQVEIAPLVDAQKQIDDASK
jgi:type II secretory pathway component PulF